MGLAQNLTIVQQRVAAAARRSDRHPDEITLVAVSKTVDADNMREALGSGIKVLGENRVQEARDKWRQIQTELNAANCEYHLIGHLQRNKAKIAVQLFDLIHSLDSHRLAEELDRRAGEIGKQQRVLIEVNTSGEETKFGCSPHEVDNLTREVFNYPNLKLEGLMTVGPLYGGTIGARKSFQMLRQLREDLGGKNMLPELSMGMTQDFEIAIEEGATLIRVGTAIFGARS